jgi:hypothetical protein
MVYAPCSHVAFRSVRLAFAPSPLSFGRGKLSEKPAECPPTKFSFAARQTAKNMRTDAESQLCLRYRSPFTSLQVNTRAGNCQIRLLLVGWYSDFCLSFAVKNVRTHEKQKTEVF